MQYVSPIIGARDDYQQQVALYEGNLLKYAVVDFAIGCDSSLRRVKRLKSRVIRGIPSEKIIIDGRSFASEVLRRSLGTYNRRSYLYGWLLTASLAGQRAAVLAKNHNCGIFSDTYSAVGGFRTGIFPKVLFHTHPNIEYLIDLYRPIVGKKPKYTNLPLALEEDFNAPRTVREGLAVVPRLADKIITSSSFTKQSLVSRGIAEDLIDVVPYGVDASVYFPVSEIDDQRDFTAVFAGRFSDRKNINGLISAWLHLSLKRAKLLLLGDSFDVNTQDELSQYGIVCRGRVSEGDMVGVISSSSVLILPSFAEGFGLVLLQAIACGTPIIATKYSGGPDILDKYRVGYIFDPFKPKDLENAIKLAYEDRTSLRMMRKTCLDAARYFTWKRFRDGIVEAAKL